MIRTTTQVIKRELEESNRAERLFDLIFDYLQRVGFTEEEIYEKMEAAFKITGGRKGRIQ